MAAESIEMLKTLDVAGSEQTTLWKDIKVGDLLLVRDNELFPADLICLKSNLAENVCFIRTTNLDGESNLKIRKPVDLKDMSDPDLDTVGDGIALTAVLSFLNLRGPSIY